MRTEAKVACVAVPAIGGVVALYYYLKPKELVADANGPYTGIVGSPVKLHGSAKGGTAPYSYAWDLDNDGIYETPGPDPVITWAEAGTYTIHLKVTDDAGDEATDEASVMITTLATEITDFAIRANNSEALRAKQLQKA